MAFLAARPDRRGDDEAVLGDAFQEAFPSGVMAPEVAAWLNERRRTPIARERAHGGAAHPCRHVHARPSSLVRREARRSSFR
jgi:hypothetical protein